MVFPPLASYLIDMYGWQNCLRIFSALHLICAGLSLSYRPITASLEDDVPSSRQNFTNEKSLEMTLRPRNEQYNGPLAQYKFGYVIGHLQIVFLILIYMYTLSTPRIHTFMCVSERGLILERY